MKIPQEQEGDGTRPRVQSWYYIYVIKRIFQNIFTILVFMTLITNLVLGFLIVSNYKSQTSVNGNSAQVSDYDYSKINLVRDSVTELMKKTHFERRNEFFRRNAKYFRTKNNIKELTLEFGFDRPSSYDFSNNYTYLMSACYYDESQDCVGPELTNAGIEVTQDESISTVEIQEIYFVQLNNNPVYFVTMKTDVGIRYALFYPGDISKPGLSYYSYLSNYKVINSSPDNHEIFSVVKSMDKDMVFAHSVRDEDVSGVRHSLKINIVDNKVDVELERETGLEPAASTLAR